MEREDDEYSEEESEKEPLCLQRITNLFGKTEPISVQFRIQQNEM